MSRYVIILDIDGVLVTTPSWKVPEIDVDGFMKFNEKASKNLSRIISNTAADIVLITSHRDKYNLKSWKTIMLNRNIAVDNIFVIDQDDNSNSNSRVEQIKNWVSRNGTKHFVIIDDDTMLENLPFSIKNRWVRTKPLVGLDEDATNKALSILENTIR